MQEKFCDIVVANDVSKKDVGFNSDFNEVTVIEKNGNFSKLKEFKKICCFDYCQKDCRKIFEE